MPGFSFAKIRRLNAPDPAGGARRHSALPVDLTSLWLQFIGNKLML
jgi:hypothetical protein